MYIPPGFSAVTPYFIVKDAERFIEFLINGLGGTEVLRSEHPPGRIANAQVQIGGCTVMVGEATEKYAPTRVACYLYVENADQAMEQAIQAGGSIEMAVANMPYGDRQGGVKDPHGNIWWVSERIVEEPYSA